jgi:hypothetical protein
MEGIDNTHYKMIPEYSKSLFPSFEKKEKDLSN